MQDATASGADATIPAAAEHCEVAPRTIAHSVIGPELRTGQGGNFARMFRRPLNNGEQPNIPLGVRIVG